MPLHVALLCLLMLTHARAAYRFESLPVHGAADNADGWEVEASKTPIECQPDQSDSVPGFGPFCFHVYVAESAQSIVDRVAFWAEPSTMVNTTLVHEPYNVSSTDVWLSVKWNGDGQPHQNWNVSLFYLIHGRLRSTAEPTANYLEVPMALGTTQFSVGSAFFNMTGGDQAGLLPLVVGWKHISQTYKGVMNLALCHNTSGVKTKC